MASHWRVVLVCAGLALIGATLTLAIRRGFDPGVRALPPQATTTVPTAEAPVVFSGFGSQTTSSFYLVGGTYRTAWAAWGEAPEFPPCTHSVELLAVDPVNAETSLGHVANLATLVQVPATGVSVAGYVYDVKPGDYYMDVNSACGWQVAVSPA